MDTSRIKGDVITIDENEVSTFFEQRAQKFSDKHLLTSVMYQDNFPQLAEQRDLKEKEIVLPLLNLTGEENVLDIGCGIGRWAKTLCPAVKNYVGIDASKGLIKQANSYTQAENAEFIQLNADELDSSKILRKKGPFDLFVIAGLFMYLNDEQVIRVLNGISNCMKKECKIYIREPFSIGSDRLTLNSFWSDELSCRYSAIYRTREEFLQLWKSVFSLDQFCEVEFQPLFTDEALNNRLETQQMYSIIKRKII